MAVNGPAIPSNKAGKEELFTGDFRGLFDNPEMDFNPWDFVRILPDRRQVITTEKLVEYLRRWKICEGKWPDNRKFERSEADINLRHIEQPTFLPVSDELSLSIIVSAEALNSAGSTTLTATFRAGWSPSTLLMNRIKRDGWCRDVIFSLMENFSQTRLLYHASTLGKPMTNEHHGDCDFMEYKRNFFDERNYSVQHVSGCLGCEFKGPSVDKVIEILRCGGIPVVARQMAGGELQVEVCKCDLNDYLALSHVWSDGLGNPHDNLLPSCQLKRLQSIMNKAVHDNSTPIAWWCDTLCVPVHLPDEDYKNIAIQRMRETFEGAIKVVALDNDLLQVSKDASTMKHYILATLETTKKDPHVEDAYERDDAP
ncbi:MAG: hypothetical protein MMC33_009637 [Icmadophila ericetorum]|nr:hypothetical protein [Icmadophila ericetorum]